MCKVRQEKDAKRPAFCRVQERCNEGTHYPLACDLSHISTYLRASGNVPDTPTTALHPPTPFLSSSSFAHPPTLVPNSSTTRALVRLP